MVGVGLGLVWGWFGLVGGWLGVRHMGTYLVRLVLSQRPIAQLMLVGDSRASLNVTTNDHGVRGTQEPTPLTRDQELLEVVVVVFEWLVGKVGRWVGMCE